MEILKIITYSFLVSAVLFVFGGSLIMLMEFISEKRRISRNYEKQHEESYLERYKNRER